jgi:hypothetical protein
VTARFVIGRSAASILLAAGLLFATTGCTLFAVQGTLRHYEPSDGIGATVGQVKVRNAIALSSDGKDVAIVMTVVNEGDSTANVTFQATDSTGAKTDHTVAVQAHSAVSVGNEGDAQLVFRGVNTTVGGLLPIYVQYSNTEGKQILVPVLDGSMESYANLLPSPEPSVSATPTVTATPTPTPTPSN